MKIANDGTSLEILIDGYQFLEVPDSPDEKWDANWLNIRGS